MTKQAFNPIGGEITINSSEYEILNTDIYGTSYSTDFREVYNLIFKNIGDKDLEFKINNGQKMILRIDDGFSCGDYQVRSFKIYTNLAKIKFSAFMGESFKEENIN